MASAQLEGFEDMDDDSKAEAIRKLMADRKGGCGGGGGGFGGGGGMPNMMGQGGKEVPDDEKRDILEKVMKTNPELKEMFEENARLEREKQAKNPKPPKAD